MSDSAWVGVKCITKNSWGPLRGDSAGEACFKILERFEHSPLSRIESVIVPSCSALLIVDIVRRCANLRGLTSLSLLPAADRRNYSALQELDEALSRPQSWLDLTHLSVDRTHHHFMSSKTIPDGLSNLTYLSASMYPIPALQKLKRLKKLRLVCPVTMMMGRNGFNPYEHNLGGLCADLESLVVVADQNLTSLRHFSHLTKLRKLHGLVMLAPDPVQIVRLLARSRPHFRLSPTIFVIGRKRAGFSKEPNVPEPGH